MKKIILITYITTTYILCLSCSKDNNTSNPYQGNWSGNLIGEPYSYSGTWSGKISSSGNFSGKVITTQSSPNHDLIIAGQVNENGTFIGTMKNTNYNITLDCNGIFQNNTCNGNWIFNGAGMEGTWNGTKN
jgi:hypothetical protein